MVDRIGVKSGYRVELGRGNISKPSIYPLDPNSID